MRRILTKIPLKSIANDKKERRLALSKDAKSFLGWSIPKEQTAEIAPVLRRWRNRKILRHVGLDEYFEFGSLDRLTPYLRDVLELRGVADFEESCLSAWLIGILPISDGEKKHSNQTLLNFLAVSKELDANRRRHRWLRALGRTTLFSAPVSYFLISWILSLELSWPLFSHTGIEAFVLILYALIATTIVLTIPLFPFGVGLSSAYDESRQSKIDLFCIASLGKLGFPESTGVLAKECLSRNSARANQSLSALCKVLPNIRPEVGSELSKETIPTLSKVLLRLNSPGLFSRGKEKEKEIQEEDRFEEAMLLILDSFEKMGDSCALRAVTQVAKKARSEAIRERAISITPLLAERARMENDRNLLLRGSDKPLHEEELLMPAFYTPETKHEELLRSSNLSGEL